VHNSQLFQLNLDGFDIFLIIILINDNRGFVLKLTGTI
jgi:hypothetical protein